MCVNLSFTGGREGEWEGGREGGRGGEGRGEEGKQSLVVDAKSALR